VAETARELYEEGRRLWNHRTEDGLRAAIATFERAARLDPAFARAYAGLADAHLQLGDYRYVAPRDAYPRAREAAERALALEPDLAEAHASLGWVRCLFDWDEAGARAAFERALALDPRYPVAYHFYGFCLGSLGRTEEGRGILARAERLDPGSRIIATDRAVLAVFDRRLDEAAARLRALLDRDPAFVTARFSLGMVHGQMGRHEQAIVELREAVQRSERSSLTLALLAHALAAAGQTVEARSLLAELRERGRTRYVSSYDLAAIHVALGEPEAALGLLEAAVEERAPWMLQLGGDARFDRLRADPRLEALVRRAGLPRWPAR
jgi:tetratricopeptide (TPR) repeat protein